MDGETLNTSFLPYFKSSYAHGGMIPRRELELLGGLLKNITGENGITVSGDFGRGIRIKGTGGGIDVTRIAFGTSCHSTTAMVQKGRVDVIGTGLYWDVAKVAALPLTGDYAWVCVQKTIDGGTPSIVCVADTYPAQSGTVVTIPLARFVKNGTTYTPDGEGYILHLGDIHLQAPLAYS